MKVCFRCNVAKPESEFYRHPNMGDGRLGKCRDCAKADVRENYRKRREQYRAYEQQRRQTAERKAAGVEGRRRHRKRHPERERARRAVWRAIRKGLLVRGACQVCGIPDAEAHHGDYSKPLVVDWLCRMHHRIEEGRWVGPLLEV